MGVMSPPLNLNPYASFLCTPHTLHRLPCSKSNPLEMTLEGFGLLGFLPSLTSFDGGQPVPLVELFSSPYFLISAHTRRTSLLLQVSEGNPLCFSPCSPIPPGSFPRKKEEYLIDELDGAQVQVPCWTK